MPATTSLESAPSANSRNYWTDWDSTADLKPSPSIDAAHSLLGGDLLLPDAEEFNSAFRFLKKLGTGGFADVYKIKYKDEFLALKVMPENASRKCKLQFLKEAKAMKACQGSRHIVAFHAIVRIPVGSKALRNKDVQWAIIMELCEAGSLGQYIIQDMRGSAEGHKYDRVQGLRWCLQVAEGLNFMHNMQPPMAHRDVKGDNILLKEENGELVAKVTDLGLHVNMDLRCGPPLVISSSPRSLSLHMQMSKPSSTSLRHICMQQTSPDVRQSPTIRSEFGPLSAVNLTKAMSRGGLLITSNSTINETPVVPPAGYGRVSGASCSETAAPDSSMMSRRLAELSAALESSIQEGYIAVDSEAHALHANYSAMSSQASLSEGFPLSGALDSVKDQKPRSNRNIARWNSSGLTRIHQTGHRPDLAFKKCMSVRSMQLMLPLGMRYVGDTPSFRTSIGNSAPLLPDVSNVGAKEQGARSETLAFEGSRLRCGGSKLLSGDNELVHIGEDEEVSLGSFQGANSGTENSQLAGTSFNEAGQGQEDAPGEMEPHLMKVWAKCMLREVLGGEGLPDDEDFELAFNFTGETGSPFCMPPEIFVWQHYNTKIDVFSLGIVMYELFSWNLLCIACTVGMPDPMKMRKIFPKKISQGWRPPRPKGMDDDIWKLINWCWAGEPTERPDMSVVMEVLKGMLPEKEVAKEQEREDLERGSVINSPYHVQTDSDGCGQPEQAAQEPSAPATEQKQQQQQQKKKQGAKEHEKSPKQPACCVVC